MLRVFKEVKKVGLKGVREILRRRDAPSENVSKSEKKTMYIIRLLVPSDYK